MRFKGMAFGFETWLLHRGKRNKRTGAGTTKKGCRKVKKTNYNSS